MNIGIVIEAELAKKKEVVDEADEHAETPRAQSGNNANREGKNAHEREVSRVVRVLRHTYRRAMRHSLPSNPAWERPISAAKDCLVFSETIHIPYAPDICLREFELSIGPFASQGDGYLRHASSDKPETYGLGYVLNKLY